MLGVPLLREGTPIGVIALTRSVVAPFTDKQIELVTTFADQAVIAIENVRLFDDVQARTRELSEALEQQTAMSEVLRVISSSPTDLAPVFDTILNNATRLCSGNFAVLWQYDGEVCSSALRSTTYRRGSPSFAETRSCGPGRRGRSGWRRWSAGTTHVVDITAEPGYSPASSSSRRPARCWPSRSCASRELLGSRRHMSPGGGAVSPSSRSRWCALSPTRP